MIAEDDFLAKDDDGVSIPRAALNKFLKELIPDARITNETRELLLSCCHKFIHTLASKSSHACAEANKKTINPEHVFQGLNLMGLSHYVEEAKSASDEAKSEITDRKKLRSSNKFKKHDPLEMENLMKEQQAFFQQARETLMENQRHLSLEESSSSNHNEESNSEEIVMDGVFKIPQVPSLTGSARILANFDFMKQQNCIPPGNNGVARENEDDYD